MRDGSADQLRPHHCFSIMVTWGSSIHSTQDSGWSVRDRSQDRRGHLLYTLTSVGVTAGIDQLR